MVKTIVGGAGTGKTRELLKFAHDNNCTVVCSDVERMIEKAHSYDFVGLKFINYVEFWAIESGLDPNGYCIDDIDYFCETIGVKAFTLVK